MKPKSAKSLTASKVCWWRSPKRECARQSHTWP